MADNQFTGCKLGVPNHFTSTLSGSVTNEKLKQHFNFINTKKTFKKLYMFYFKTFRIILNPSSVRK